MEREGDEKGRSMDLYRVYMSTERSIEREGKRGGRGRGVREGKIEREGERGGREREVREGGREGKIKREGEGGRERSVGEAERGR